MEFLHRIKIIFIILYIFVLGFIVFGNSSVFGADTYNQEYSVYQVSTGLDNYFINCQDNFDNQLLNYQNKSAYNWFYNYFYTNGKYTNWNYFVLPVDHVPGHESDSISYARGWVIYEYAIGNLTSNVDTNSNFTYLDLNNFHIPFERYY